MSLRNRITEYVQSVLSTRIRCTQGNILLGRKASGVGYSREITLGAGITIDNNGVLNVDAASDVADLTTDGLTAGNMLRVASGGGLEQRTPAQVRDAVVPVLTRTAAQGSPAGGLTVAGIITTGEGVTGLPASVFLPETGTLNTKPLYGVDGVDCIKWNGSSWRIEHNGILSYSSAEDVATPDLVVTWTPNGSAVGTPDLTLEAAVTPAFTGQKCIVGDNSPGNGNRLEFTSLDGTTWTLTGPAGVVEDDDTPGTYYKITTASGVLNTELYTLS